MQNIQINPIPLDECWEMLQRNDPNIDAVEVLLSILYWKEKLNQLNSQGGIHA